MFTFTSMSWISFSLNFSFFYVIVITIDKDIFRTENKNTPVKQSQGEVSNGTCGRTDRTRMVLMKPRANRERHVLNKKRA